MHRQIEQGCQGCQNCKEDELEPEGAENIRSAACERRRKQSHRRAGTKQKPERFRRYATRRKERREEVRGEAEAAVEGRIEKQKAGQHISWNAHARRSISHKARRLSPGADAG